MKLCIILILMVYHVVSLFQAELKGVGGNDDFDEYLTEE